MSATDRYAALDAAIVKAIRNGRGDGRDKLWDVKKTWPRKQWSSRLQSLRKRGLIEYNNGRWSAVGSGK